MVMDPMDINSTHTSTLLHDTSVSSSGFGIHSSLSHVKLPRKKTAMLDEFISGNWLDSMKSSSPQHRRKNKISSNELAPADPEDSYLTWMLKYPTALASFDEIMSFGIGKRVVLFLDYDGTLSPIVDNPDLAFMSTPMRRALKNVARRFPTAIISGRSQDKVYDFVQLKELCYAGSHGMDIMIPVSSCTSNTVTNLTTIDKQGNKFCLFQPAHAFLPVIDEIIPSLLRTTSNINGVRLENNKFCISVHYRNVDEKSWPNVLKCVQDILKLHPTLCMTHGRKVLEIRPVIDWDKGKAVKFLLESLGLIDDGEVLSLYIGDDRTDEDAFKVLRDENMGYGIIVSTVPKQSNAKFSLRDPSEVLEFLKLLVEWNMHERH